MFPLLLIVSLTAGADGDPTTRIMEGNLLSIYVLQEYLASPTAFRDPENTAIIDGCLDSLVRVPHRFLGAGAEPTPAAISTIFGAQVRRARVDFEQGRPESARLRLRGLTGMCLGCHSRAAAGADRPGVVISEQRLKVPTERAQFLAAIRQYDAALALWKELLRAPPTNLLETFDQTMVLRAAVGVAVRAKDDPKVTLELLESVAGRKGQPAFFGAALAEWTKEARAWNGEHFVSGLQSPDALFNRARALIASTRAASTVVPDEEHLISLLRASAYLNAALARDPTPKWRGEALYLLGLASSAVLDPELWEVDGLYLEGCVRENPHTALAVRCAERLADRITWQYTSSQSAALPAEVGARVAELRALAR